MKKTDYRVTAVIPARNCRRALARCIRALLSGDCPTDLIVVDDASEDGTAEMVKEKWPSAVVLRLPVHTGFAHAANLGLRLVRTEYAFLIRPGLEPGRSCVRRLLEAFGEDTLENTDTAPPAAGGTAGPVSGEEDLLCAVPEPIRTGTERRAGRAAGHRQSSGGGKNPHRNTPHRNNPHRTKEVLAVPDGCALYRMTALEETGWFDERHYDGLEALDLSLRAAALGLRTVQAGGAYVRPVTSVRPVLPGEDGESGGERDASGRCNAYGLPMDTLRRQLAAGNGVYVLYKHLSPLHRVLCGPVLARAGAAAKAAFAGRGESEEYDMALERGRALCSLDRERGEALREGVSVWAESLPDAAFLGMEEAADRIYPMYLAQKEPFSLSDLPGSAAFQAQLLRELPQILRLFL